MQVEWTVKLKLSDSLSTRTRAGTTRVGRSVVVSHYGGRVLKEKGQKRAIWRAILVKQEAVGKLEKRRVKDNRALVPC